MDKPFYEKVAEYKGWGINPNKEVVDVVVEGLLHNRDTRGAMYCPCLLTCSPETLCPCKEWRDNPDMKICHCQLYTRP